MSRFRLDIDHASELRNRKIIDLSDASDIESSAGLVEQFSGVIGVSKKLRPAGAFLGNFTVPFAAWTSGPETLSSCVFYLVSTRFPPITVLEDQRENNRVTYHEWTLTMLRFFLNRAVSEAGYTETARE